MLNRIPERWRGWITSQRLITIFGTFVVLLTVVVLFIPLPHIVNIVTDILLSAALLLVLVAMKLRMTASPTLRGKRQID